MAGQLLNITRSIVTLTDNTTSTPYWQLGKDALDVTGYGGARFDFGLKVYLIDGTTPSVTVKLYTSMYNDDNDGTWALLGSFGAVTASNTAVALSVTSGVLRYVKWKLEWTGMTLVSFEVLGVGW